MNILTQINTTITMNLVSVKRAFNGEDKLIPLGESVAIIANAAETFAKVNANWSDRTPQLEVKFENESGQMLTHWYNLQGYQTKADFEGKAVPKGITFASSENGNEDYAIKGGARIVSEEKTAECERIVGEFINDSGLPAGEEITDSNQLVGLQIGLMVRDGSRGFREVHYTKLASKVKAVEA